MLLLLRVNISYFIYVLNLGSINFEINKGAKSTMFKKSLEEN